MRFILGAKPADHKALFKWVESTERMNTGAVKHIEHTDAQGVHHRFRYLNAAPLNDTHFDLEVNFLEYWETHPNGKTQRFSWVTDLPIDDANVMALMRGARARWRIENETFNTLKNQGYSFEHNFGHGERHLSTVFAYLMMLAFLIDQCQQRCCALFESAQAKAERARYFWDPSVHAKAGAGGKGTIGASCVWSVVRFSRSRGQRGERVHATITQLRRCGR